VGNSIPVMVGGTLLVALACLELAIAANEREDWGPRVARTIPRNPLVRPLAFLVYSGAAGGITIAAVLYAAAVLSGLAWRHLVPDPLTESTWPVVLQVWAALGLYTWCYTLSAVLVRRLLQQWVKRVHTWVVGMVLLLLGTSVPFLVLYLLYTDPLRRGFQEPLWAVTNPFVSIAFLLPHRLPLPEGEYAAACLSVLSAWAVLVGVLNARWFAAQVGRFRPAAAAEPVSK
jgi:hypothetical protein